MLEVSAFAGAEIQVGDDLTIHYGHSFGVIAKLSLTPPYYFSKVTRVTLVSMVFTC